MSSSAAGHRGYASTVMRPERQYAVNGWSSAGSNQSIPEVRGSKYDSRTSERQSPQVTVQVDSLVDSVRSVNSRRQPSTGPSRTGAQYTSSQRR